MKRIHFPSLLVGIALIVVLILILVQLNKVEFTWKSESMGEKIPEFYQWK